MRMATSFSGWLCPRPPFPVLDSRVTVTLLSDRPPQVTASYPDTWLETIDGTTITWEAPGRLGNNSDIEVRAVPARSGDVKPGWQASFDRCAGTRQPRRS